MNFNTNQYLFPLYLNQHIHFLFYAWLSFGVFDKRLDSFTMCIGISSTQLLYLDFFVLTLGLVVQHLGSLDVTNGISISVERQEWKLDGLHSLLYFLHALDPSRSPPKSLKYFLPIKKSCTRKQLFKPTEKVSFNKSLPQHSNDRVISSLCIGEILYCRNKCLCFNLKLTLECLQNTRHCDSTILWSELWFSKY